MDYKKVFKDWLDNSKLGENGFKELNSIIDNDKEIEYRFGAQLEFGTAGMRGLIGYGTNMMNEFTVRRAAQGLSQYILGLDEKLAKKVAISYDTRQKSKEFAMAAAAVLAQNGIYAYVFDEVSPVPMLSFAVRKLGAVAGIMITASHNPKEYNGFKVYGADGAQMSIEATEKVVEYINSVTDIFDVKFAKFDSFKNSKNAFIKKISKKVDKAYYKELKKLSLSKDSVKRVGKSIKLVYTPLHGSGFVPVMTILKKIGIKATPVESQTNYDPLFSTVEVPNPEFKESLSRAIELADNINADAVFGTDPDCDRLGAAVRNSKGEFEALSGNQIGILLLDYILTRLKDENKISENGFIVKSFVTTSMAKAIADDFGVELFETPVGFKFIGEMIKKYETNNEKQFIFGFEESCGYLRGTHCRDKDAVVASMLFAEMVCYYADKNISVYQRLCNIYDRYGFVLDKNINIAYSGINAMRDMNAVIDSLREKTVTKFDIFNVAAVRDYFKGVKKMASGEVVNLDIKSQNSFFYELENGSFVCLRPSGTEPKLKIYYSIKASDAAKAQKFFVKIDKAVQALIKV